MREKPTLNLLGPGKVYFRVYTFRKISGGHQERIRKISSTTLV